MPWSRCPSLSRSTCNNTPLRFLLIYNLHIFLSQESLKMKRFIGGNRIFYKFREFSFCVQIYFDKFLLRLENCNFRAFRSVFRQNWRKLTPAEIHFYPRKQVWCIPKAQLRPSIGCGTEINSRTSGSYYYTVDKTWNILIVNYY